MPAALAEHRLLSEQVKEEHETSGKIVSAVNALQALAVLVHQFYWRDNTLRRMLP